MACIGGTVPVAPSTEDYRGLRESAENAIDHLEALATIPDGKMQ